MARYYDERCPSCDGCGWFGRGSYPDGRPYERCGWFGYILDRRSEEGCDARMTGTQVDRYLEGLGKRAGRGKV